MYLEPPPLLVRRPHEFERNGLEMEGFSLQRTWHGSVMNSKGTRVSNSKNFICIHIPHS